MTHDKFRYPLNLQLFAETEPPADPSPDPMPADPQPPVDTKTFTQDELDRIVTDRVSRERKKYGDYDDIKTQLDALLAEKQEREKADMTALERLEAEKAEALERARLADEARESALSAANQRLITAEFRAKARELNVRPDAVDAALKLADLSTATVDETGSVVGVEDAIKVLLAGNAYLIDVPQQPNPIGSPSGGEPKPDKTKEQIIAEAAAKVRENPTPDRIAQYTQLKRELGI